MARLGLFTATALAISILGTFFIKTRATIQSELVVSFQSDAENLTQNISNTFRAASLKLQSVIGFFEASQEVDENELNTFINATRFFSENDHIRAIAVMPVLQRDEIDLFSEQLARRTDARRNLGYEPISIRVDPARLIYAPAVYVASPSGPKGVLGYDLASSPVRLATALTAQKNKQVYMSPPVTLSQDTKDSYPSVLIIGATDGANLGLRDYWGDEPSRPAFIAASYTPGAILEQIFEDIADPTFDMALFDVTDATRINVFQSSDTLSEQPSLSKTFAVGGREWKIDFHPNAVYHGAHNLIWLTVIFVIGLTLLLALSFMGNRLINNSQILSQRIIERTRELATAKEDAENANMAKSEFLAAMSHDLRTPLNAIMGFSEIMRDKTFGELGDPRYVEYAADINNSGSLLVSLINDVLDLSKIETGKYVLSEEVLDIGELVKRCFRQLENMAQTSHQTLVAQVPDDMPSLRGEERAMMQLLNNLVSNAIKFTPEGGQVTVSAELNARNSIVLQVVDTGIGMSKEGIVKALQPFEQIEGLYAHRYMGSGLGLHICTKFMNLFGGTLDIESEIGTGTRIIIRFPPERTASPT